MWRTRITTLLVFILELCPVIHIFTSFSEHNFTTFRNTLMILGRIRTGQRGVLLVRMTTLLISVFELCPLIHIFTSFLEHNFATV